MSSTIPGLDTHPGVPPETFRDVFGHVCTPVAVVTAFDGARPHGTTVSAFTALSMTPPMVLVALDRGSQVLATLRSAGSFGVNVLAAQQAGIATAFARKGEDKFDGIGWDTDGGVPRITGSAGWLACAVSSIVDGGDHEVVMGTVIGAHRHDIPPLTYHARTFGTHAAADR